MEHFFARTQFIKIIKKQLNLPSSVVGVTIIELLIVIGIIAILVATLGIIFNPFAQITKSQNANRIQDLHQIQQALDAYMNDTGCYPTSIPFGTIWSAGSTVYMEKVPEDPLCSSTNMYSCYNYQTDGSNCSQWNILYATMHAPISTSISSCIVVNTPSCLPVGGLQTYNYCSVSGKMDCTVIAQNAIPTPVIPASDGGSGGGGGGGGGNPTPTSICNGQLSACSNGICNVEQANQCSGCGGSMQCYSGLTCGGVNCSGH